MSRCPNWASCFNDRAPDRAMCFECMEAQLRQNQGFQLKRRRQSPVDIEDTGGLYDYASAFEDQQDKDTPPCGPCAFLYSVRRESSESKGDRRA